MTNSNSFTPVINVSFFISNFFSFSIFSSDVPSISIKSIIFFIESFYTSIFSNSSITASFPILSILSIILNTSTDFSF